MDNSIIVLVTIRGQKNGKIEAEAHELSTVPEESLASLIDQIKTELEGFVVKTITIID
jgi:hypothetical protein